MHKKLFIFSVIVFFSVQCKKDEISKSEQANYEHFGTRTFIPDNNPSTQEGIDLGRFLFYEKRLSKNRDIACASCHQQDKAFTDGKAFSTGHGGLQTDRSAMSLVNLMWVDKLFWDGRAISLEEQALIPIQAHNEMNLTLEEAVARLENIDLYPTKFKAAFGSKEITPERIAKALAQFQRTLISANARYDKIIRGEVEATERETNAIELFMTHPIPEISLRGGNCGDCHGSNLTTLNTFHDNGLDISRSDLGLGGITMNPNDNFKMRAPSLRNIEFTAPYMQVEQV